MIYVGYQGIGKSSIAGKHNCVQIDKIEHNLLDILKEKR